MRAIVVLPILMQSVLTAQSPPVFEPLGDPLLIEKGLQSTTPLQVAVAASDAAIFLRDTSPRVTWLRQALARSLSLEPQSEAIRTQRIILDTLIRTRTPVPLTELLPFFDHFPAAVIALVRKGLPNEKEDRLPLLLKAEEQKNLACWYAAASLTNWDQLIHHLAPHVRFDYPITIVDQDFLPIRKYRNLQGGPMGGVLGGVLGGITNGSVQWPDEVTYYIETSGDPDQLLTSGPGEPTYLKKAPHYAGAVSDRPSPNPGAWSDHDRDIVRILLPSAYPLRAIFEEGVPDIHGGEATFVWHSPQQAVPLLKQAIDRYVHECGVLLKKLGEPAPAEAELRARVRIWIRDRRETKTVPIPSVGAGTEFTLCTAYQPHANSKCVD